VKLLDVLNLPQARTALRQFQQKQFASENIEFYEAAQVYAKQTKPAGRAKFANQILDSFIIEHAPQEINIDMK
jgi:Regulator of G protein signaling domain